MHSSCRISKNLSLNSTPLLNRRMKEHFFQNNNIRDYLIEVLELLIMMYTVVRKEYIVVSNTTNEYKFLVNSLFNW